MRLKKQPVGPGQSIVSLAIASCRRHLGYAAGFSAIINLLYIAPTIYMLQVYDRVIPSRGFATLAFLTVLLLVSLAALAMLDLVRTRLLIRASSRLEKALSGSILRAVMDRRSSGNGPQLMRDFDQLRQTITGSGALALFDAPWTLVYVALCFVLHPLLGGVAILGSAALIGLTLATEHATRSRLQEANQAAALSYASQGQSAAAADVVQALGMREALVLRHQGERASVMRLQAEASFAAGRYLGLTKFMRLSLQSLGLGIAAYLAINQQISAGAIFAASLLIARTLSPIEQILGSWRQLEEARNAYGRLCADLANEGAESPRTALPAPAGRMLLEGVSVLSPGRDRLLLQNIGFAVAPGEVLGVVGASGAGKSTLLRAIVGAVTLERGVVRLDGASIGDWDADRLGRHIGYLPQDVGLLQGTVKENICRFRHLTGESVEDIDAKVIAAAKACGAHDMILRLPDGYDTALEWGGRGVSLGQAQRIGLARALYEEPAILALDEPNAHLDADGELTLLRAIEMLKARGVAIVVVAHRASLLETMDKLLVLAGGQVSDIGRRADVMRRLNKPPVHPVEREVA